MKTIILLLIFNTFLLTCYAEKLQEPEFDIKPHPKADYLKPYYKKLHQLRKLIGEDNFVEVPTEEEIEVYKKHSNANIKPIEDDYLFEKHIFSLEQKLIYDFTFENQKKYDEYFSKFNKLYEENRQYLAEHTVGLWNKIHEVYEKHKPKK